MYHQPIGEFTANVVAKRRDLFDPPHVNNQDGGAHRRLAVRLCPFEDFVGEREKMFGAVTHSGSGGIYG